MCKIVNGEHVMPGWACCKCHTYNGVCRTHCKHCGRSRCPSWQLVLAVAIELTIVETFFADRSFFGLVLCLAYAWFSATRVFVFPGKSNDGEL